MSDRTDAEIIRTVINCDEWGFVEDSRNVIALNRDQIVVRFGGPDAVVTFTDPYGEQEVTIRMRGWSYGTLAALLSQITLMTNIARSHRNRITGEV